MSKISVYLNTLRQKGYLAYEYNPFHNYLTEVDLYLVDNKFLVPYGLAVNAKNGELLTKKNDLWIDKRGRIIKEDVIEVTDKSKEQWVLYAKAGSLIDLETDLLNFDLDHPVDITVLPSYDGSVNLILNDDKNIPRLINSRFSVREKNTYEIVDRIGENDTNIYNSETFDKDTSLYFQYEYNPIVSYDKYINGRLLVGNYCFYFTYCDSDNNESDYIAESGLIPIFIGNDSDPYSMDGGIKNQLTTKGIRLKLENLDKSFNYLKVYYVRYFADYQLNRVHECKKIYQRYPINSSTLYLQITGNEEAEDIDANILNITRFNPKSILTQALCKNTLFFGNIVKNSDNYRELLDCALRIIPQIKKSTLEDVSNEYSTISGSGYYSSSNIYNRVGYFNLEYYRFGVVFIYLNGTLSNVYNTLGCLLNTEETIEYQNSLFENPENLPLLLKRKYISIDDFGWIKNSSDFISNQTPLFVNAKGVCKLGNEEQNINEIYGIEFKVPEEVVNYLKEDLSIRGLFFVRQKRVPSSVAQCLIFPMDELLEAPVIKTSEGEYKTECFVGQKNTSENLLVTNSYYNRLYKYKFKKDNSETSISSNAYAGICPDFLLNLPYYNQIFNGSTFRLSKIEDTVLSNNSNVRIYTSALSLEKYNNYSVNGVKICTVTENVPSVALYDKVFKLEMGATEEVHRFKYAEVDNGTYDAGNDNKTGVNKDKETINKSTNLVRGIYSPYLAIYSSEPLTENGIYNIYLSESTLDSLEFQNRMNSAEPFYAISNRYNFDSLTKVGNSKTIICWRGDCYINTFTYRLNRNFNDPSLPNNDVIIDKNTWKDNYDVFNSSKWTNISRSDLNAVQMGTWITFKVRSSMNYALRSQDHSYVSEEALMGSPRSFYPRSQMMWKGANKLPDSYLYNDAFRATLGFKCYFTLQDINYIKDTFSNRILYSAISIQDSFKNNYRYSLSTYFRDYSLEYGSIIKLIGFEGYLLVVFEHAIGIAVVNERVLAGGGDGEPVFINTQNILPEELTIITDTYGTQWGESVVKSEAGYVYGVDTIAKKIWRVKGQEIEILSDFKVNKFLIDNISLGERELYPTVGLKNVKTHYNNNKKDIMFTFYDDVYKDEEKVWNLCYNELLGEFVTFYSWLPSYSENIDTQFFTFNRDTAKGLSLLGKCNYSIPENVGILVDNPVLKDDELSADLYYCASELVRIKLLQNDDSNLKLETRYEFKNVSFKLEKDHWHNYELFDEDELKKGVIKVKSATDAYKAFLNLKVLYLEVTPYFENDPDLDNIISDTVKSTYFKTETIALTLGSIVENPALTHEEKKSANLTTDFYLHGQSGIFDIKENVYPCNWYGLFHPFEFEFIVNDNIGLQKIFSNLIIISNKAEPESFHFEIEGDNYEFSSDKRTMYFRLEATKELFQNLGSDIIYNRHYTDIRASEYTQEQYYRGTGNRGNDGLEKQNEYKYISPYDKVYPVENTGLVQQIKSTIFPLYYEKVDTYNDIYHTYWDMKGDGYDFKNLSGSEILWNRDLNLFNIVTHIKNSPINLVGRLRGNSFYKEGKWNIQIPSITFMLKNEDWNTNTPPIVINSSNLPNDLTDPKITSDKLPNIYTRTKEENPDIFKYIDVGDWTYRKETRIRDKWMKVRVRYSGKNLAIIHSLITLYNISYS